MQRKLFTGIDPNFHSNCTIVNNYVLPKTVLEKFSFSEFKIKKVKFFTQGPTKIIYINVFNVGGCLASCLTFRPFLPLDP